MSVNNKNNVNADIGNNTKREHKQLSELEHVHVRANMYIGPLEAMDMNTYIVENKKFVKKTIKTSEGCCKLFDEILVNAIDQFTRLIAIGKKGCNIYINMTSKGVFSVMNDNSFIPVYIGHTSDKKNIWMPQLLFGCQRSGNNYDDTKKRNTHKKTNIKHSEVLQEFVVTHSL